MRDRPQATTAPLAGSPCRGDRFPRSMQEPEPSSRHLHAGRHLGSQQAPPRLIPGLQSIPGFDVTFVFRHVISGSLSLAFLAHTCRAQRRDFPVTLTTTALNRSSSRWFAASACTAAAEGHQANNASFNVRGTPRDDLRAPRLVGRRLPLRQAEASVWPPPIETSVDRPLRHSDRRPRWAPATRAKRELAVGASTGDGLARDAAGILAGGCVLGCVDAGEDPELAFRRRDGRSRA